MSYEETFILVFALTRVALALSGCATPKEVITRENLHELELLRTRSEADYIGAFFLTYTEINKMVFSPDSKLLAFGFSRIGSRRDEAIKIVDADTLNLIKVIKTSENMRLTFNGDGTILASTHKSIELWDIVKAKRIGLINYPSSAKDFEVWDFVMGIAFNPTRSLLAIADTREKSVLTLWDISLNRKIKELRGCSGRPPVFTRDGTILAVSTSAASASGGKEILLLNGEDGTVLRTLRGHTKPVCSCAFSPDGKILASSEFNTLRDRKKGTTELAIKFWDVETGQLIGEIRGHNRAIRDLHFSARGDLLVGYQEHQWGSDEGDSIVFFDVAEKKEILRISTRKWIHDLVLRPDGRAIVVDRSGELALYGIPK